MSRKPGREPQQQLRLINGAWWRKVRDSADWLELGICPVPKTRWQVFVYHFCHGTLMQYPFWDVLRFSIANSDPTGWRKRTDKLMNVTAEKIKIKSVRPLSWKIDGIQMRWLKAILEEVEATE